MNVSRHKSDNAHGTRKLLEFYTKNGFKSWTRRINEKDGKPAVEFDQMFAVLNDEPQTGGPGS